MQNTPTHAHRYKYVCDSKVDLIAERGGGSKRIAKKETEGSGRR